MIRTIAGAIGCSALIAGPSLFLGLVLLIVVGLGIMDPMPGHIYTDSELMYIRVAPIVALFGPPVLAFVLLASRSARRLIPAEVLVMVLVVALSWLVFNQTYPELVPLTLFLLGVFVAGAGILVTLRVSARR